MNRVLVTRAGASQRLRYGPSRRRERGAPTTRCSLAVVVSSAFVGAVIASRCSRNPVGWFFVVSAVTAAMSEATFRYAVYGLIIAPGSLPLARAMAWPEPWMWLVSIVLILLVLPLYFPNGRLLSSRWRPALWLAVALSARKFEFRQRAGLMCAPKDFC